MNPNSRFLDLEGLGSRAATEGVLPGWCVGMLVAWVGRVVGSVWLLAFYSHVGNSEVCE